MRYQTTLRTISRPTLERLLRDTGETVNLAIMDGLEIIYLDVLESLHTFRLILYVGMKCPIYSTFLGKIMLEALNNEKANERIYTAMHLEPMTPRTMTSVAKLKHEVAQVRILGYAIDDEEVVSGALCIGSAFLDSDGNVAGAISVSGPTSRISRDKVPALAEAVRNAAHEISLRLGFQTPTPKVRAPATIARKTAGPIKKPARRPSAGLRQTR